MGSNMLYVQIATDHGLQSRIVLSVFGNVKLGVFQVTNPRRKAETQLMHECKYVISETRRIGIVFLNPQVRLVI